MFPQNQWFLFIQEEEAAAQGIHNDKNQCSETGWEDSEFQPLEDFQPLESPGRIIDVLFTLRHDKICYNYSNVQWKYKIRRSEKKT